MNTSAGLCIMSGTGTISSVTLRQPATTEPSLTYEGRFETLSLGGTYLVNEECGSKSRTGSLSVSLSGHGGHVIGGGIGMLIAASLVQVVACSFVYGGVPKSDSNNNKTIKKEQEPKEEHNNSKMETTPTNAPEAAALVDHQTPQDFSAQGMSGSPGSGEGSVSGSGRSLDSSRNLLTDIDLTQRMIHNRDNINVSSYRSSWSIQNVIAVNIFIVVDLSENVKLESSEN